MNLPELLETLLERPIAFHRIFAKLTGSVTAGIMLSQAYYWSKNETVKQRDGWFYKGRAEWTAETTLTRYEQESARAKLRKAGFWFEDIRDHPARLYFKVDMNLLAEAVRQLVENQPTRWWKTSQQGGGKPAN